MENKIYLLTAEWCTKCPVVKNQAIINEMPHVLLDVENDELGQEIASELGIMSVPVIIDNREGKVERYDGEGKAFQFVMENFKK